MSLPLSLYRRHLFPAEIISHCGWTRAIVLELPFKDSLMSLLAELGRPSSGNRMSRQTLESGRARLAKEQSQGTTSQVGKEKGPKTILSHRVPSAAPASFSKTATKSEQGRSAKLSLYIMVHQIAKENGSVALTITGLVYDDPESVDRCQCQILGRKLFYSAITAVRRKRFPVGSFSRQRNSHTAGPFFRVVRLR